MHEHSPSPKWISLIERKNFQLATDDSIPGSDGGCVAANCRGWRCCSAPRLSSSFCCCAASWGVGRSRTGCFRRPPQHPAAWLLAVQQQLKRCGGCCGSGKIPLSDPGEKNSLCFQFVCENWRGKKLHCWKRWKEWFIVGKYGKGNCGDRKYGRKLDSLKRQKGTKHG